MCLVRIDKFLCDCGIGSRKEIKNYIKKGRVSVNEDIIYKSDLKINYTKDVIFFDNKKLIYKKYVYIMMNKPSGVISATYDKYDKTVIDFVSEKYKNINLFPVGRLDKDTVGLIILTNDGSFAHNTLSPKKHVKKIYYADVEGIITSEDIKKFEEGIVIDIDYLCKSAFVNVIEIKENISSVKIEIYEGKFHQIKKMFAAVGKKVIYLKRIQFGDVKIDNKLQEGEFRELNEIEMKLIEEYTGN